MGTSTEDTATIDIGTPPMPTTTEVVITNEPATVYPPGTAVRLDTPTTTEAVVTVQPDRVLPDTGTDDVIAFGAFALITAGLVTVAISRWGKDIDKELPG